jgi:hypothetical protein
MGMKEGTAVVVSGSHPYNGFDGTIENADAAEGYVRVRFPQIGRHGVVYEINVANLSEINWTERLKKANYDIVAPDGTIWERSFGEWTSKSFPGAKYDTEELADRYEEYGE